MNTTYAAKWIVLETPRKTTTVIFPTKKTVKPRREYKRGTGMAPERG